VAARGGNTQHPARRSKPRFSRPPVQVATQRRVIMFRPTGVIAEHASHTARGTPGFRRTCGSNGLQRASMLRGVEVRGSGDA
jgi:hypothetical protein